MYPCVPHPFVWPLRHWGVYDTYFNEPNKQKKKKEKKKEREKKEKRRREEKIEQYGDGMSRTGGL